MPRVKKPPKVKPCYGKFVVDDIGRIRHETTLRVGYKFQFHEWTVRRLLISEPPKRKGKPCRE